MRKNPQDTITIEWSIEDVIDQAESNGKKLTKAQARKVLASILHHHDCDVGINWTVINAAIIEYFSKK